jgi:hypothetical protein
VLGGFARRSLDLARAPRILLVGELDPMLHDPAGAEVGQTCIEASAGGSSGQVKPASTLARASADLGGGRRLLRIGGRRRGGPASAASRYRTASTLGR